MSTFNTHHSFGDKQT